MHGPEIIRLDTGAFGSARRRRLGRSLAYWLLLLGAAVLLAGALAAAFTLLQEPSSTQAHLAPAKKGAAVKGAKQQKPAATTAAQRGGAPVPAAQDEAAPAAAPPPADTPVAIWNGFGGQGAATTVADRARARGYPVVGVRDAPRRTYRRTYVLYVPGREAAATALARRLGLATAVVRPLDGIRPAAIRPAQLLVILAKQK